MEMMSLYAVGDPIKINVRREPHTHTTPTAMIGTLVRRSTLLTICENGVALSRAKDQIIREDVQMIPTAQAHVRMRIMTPIPVAPGTDFTLSE